MSPGFTLDVPVPENSTVERADPVDLTPVHSSPRLSSSLERCILRSPDSGDVLLWVSTPKVANRYTPLTKGARDTPLSAEHTRRASTAPELKSMIEFEAEVISPMAKRRAAEQLTMMQVKSFAQRCKESYLMQSDPGVTQKSRRVTHQIKASNVLLSPHVSDDNVQAPRISVASTAASFGSCEESDEGADVCVGFNDSSEALPAQQHFSREALIRTTILRSNAVDFTLKFAETVEIIEKTLRLKKPTRRRSVCGSADKWNTADGGETIQACC
ncbi:hypothetical protein FOL47_010985 [Perkinsus chesapeaki]|uniref:Uncharacterized protein n=1 Tax=Perkinsus chesapeaki TaxID=330153 RepID=A0A7J6MNG3_PERCH|nr:hypothetical protein FOL47_010985 [Perkinsus chesapeaki]